MPSRWLTPKLLAAALAVATSVGCSFDTSGLPASLASADATQSTQADASLLTPSDAFTTTVPDAGRVTMMADGGGAGTVADASPPDTTWQNILQDGGLENFPGPWTEWSSGGWAVINSSEGQPHAGNFAAWFGGVIDETARIRQTVTVPAGALALRVRGFMAHAVADANDDDLLDVVLRDVAADDSVRIRRFEARQDNGGIGSWFAFSIDAPSSYAGRTVELILTARTNDTGVSSLFVVDDLALEVLLVAQ